MIETKIYTKSPNKVLKYLKNLNIDIYNIKYLNDSIIIRIKEKDYKKVDKYFQNKLIKYKEKNLAKILISQTSKSISILLIILLSITILSKFIINVEVITENKELQKKILNELEKNNINKYSLVKNERQITIIKEKILQNNKNILEWMNIENIGMKYIINIEPKITKDPNKQKNYCNIISKKDAIISKITTYKGQEIKEINDSVQKGDVLISGDIKYNEELKKQVCASGKVYGHTWYTINISIPLNYELIKKEEKYRYNIKIKHNNKTIKIFNSRLKNYIEDNNLITNILGTEIYLTKEISATKKTEKYNEKEIENLIQNKITESMKHNIKGEHKILEQKVLKKEENNSKIELEVFIVVEEEIGTISENELINE